MISILLSKLWRMVYYDYWYTTISIIVIVCIMVYETCSLVVTSQFAIVHTTLLFI